jgi:hypothetical protein
MVYKEINLNPGKVLAYFDRDKSKVILFIRKLIKTGLLQRVKGSYYADDIFVGHSENEAVKFMNNPANSVLMDRLGRSLNEKLGYESEADQKNTFLVIVNEEEKQLDREAIVDLLKKEGYKGPWNLKTEKLIDKYYYMTKKQDE